MNPSVIKQSESETAMKTSTVLIIDFDADSLSSLTDFVRAEGLEVLTARDGLTGWDTFRAQHPDLVIMEAMLPKMNGFELCKKIVSDSRGATPVIMITGVYREISYRIEALQIYGASAFYSKPWNREDLRQRIFQLLNMNGDGPAHKKEAAKAAGPGPSAVAAAAPAEKTIKLSPPKPNPLTVTAMINNTCETQDPAKRPEQKIPAKDKKLSLDRDIEGMLKDTLAGLGLGTEKKKPAPKIEIPKVEAVRVESPKPEPVRIDPPKTEPVQSVLPRAEIPRMETFRAESHGAATAPPQVLKAEKPKLEIRNKELHAESVDFIKSARKPEVHSDSRKSRERKDTEAAFPVTADKIKESIIDEPRTDPAGLSHVSFDDFMEARKKSAPLMIGGLILGFCLVSGTFYLVLKPKKAQIHLVETAVATDTTVAGDSNSPPTEPEQTSSALNERLKAQIPAAAETKPAPLKKAPEKQPPALTQTEPEAAPLLAEASQLKLNDSNVQKADTSETKEGETAVNAAQAVNPPVQDPKPVGTQPTIRNEPAVPTVKSGDLVPYVEIDVVPQILRRVEPAYPALARRMEAEGNISLNVLISETGLVIRTEILKGMMNSFGLEKAAEDAVKQWRFSPAQKAGVPVKVWKAIEIVFRKDQ